MDSEEARIAVLSHGWRVDTVGSASVRARGPIVLSEGRARNAVSELLRGWSVVLAALGLRGRHGKSTASGEGLRTTVVHTVHAVDTILVSGRQDRSSVRHASDLEGSDGHLSLIMIPGSHLWGRTATCGVVGRHLGLDLAAIGGLANSRQDGTNGLNHLLLHVGSGMLEGRLDNVVRV